MTPINKITQSKIRNIAIIAHVDHGKTTLVDAFIKQSKLFRDNQAEMQQTEILDSNDLEREKGITILAKNIAVQYLGYKINIIDTPGHADFGGEVERTLNMADGCILVVDAQEGTMPQTEFVLKKALELKLKPIVIVNKIDKKFADVKRVINEISDLFLSLVTEDSQLDFPIFYAIGREGKVFTEMPTGDLTIPNATTGDLTPLLNKIIEYIPAPTGNGDEPFQMLISSLDFDAHIGRHLIGKVHRGTLKLGDAMQIATIDDDGKVIKKESGRVKQILIREGLNYIETEEGVTGDILAIAGIDSTAIGSTLCSHSKVEPLPPIKLSPPSVKITIEQNTSPFAGKEGEFVTAKQLEQRLEKEKALNIGLTIVKGEGASYFVSGRGELQLSILIETMRREGFEFQVRKPEVILKEEDGVMMEPIEKLFVDVPENYLGVVTNAVSKRRGDMINMDHMNGQVRFTYRIKTRNLLGLRNELLTLTKGTAVLNNFLDGYTKYTPEDEVPRNGVIISMETGTALGYALNMVQERGELFTNPGTEVYAGMIIGINKYEQDIEVNPCKARHQSAVRMSHAEITQTALKSVINLTLEYALVFIAKDEMLEVTPKNIRLRKVYLDKTKRDWAKRSSLTVFAKAQMGIKD
jgi:GTP-binding protein